VRAKATYRTSLATLATLAEMGVTTKSGLMVGLGESEEEVEQTLKELREAGVRLLTIGQYLRPSEEQVPVVEYITPETFERYRQLALDMGFRHCASGPLVRSSYLADEALSSIKATR
jgi:lipoic acid synthetase